jgi:hypothetical protein
VVEHLPGKLEKDRDRPREKGNWKGGRVSRAPTANLRPHDISKMRPLRWGRGGRAGTHRTCAAVTAGLGVFLRKQQDGQGCVFEQMVLSSTPGSATIAIFSSWASGSSVQWGP